MSDENNKEKENTKPEKEIVPDKPDYNNPGVITTRLEVPPPKIEVPEE